MKKSELKELIKEVIKEEMLKPSRDAIEFSKEIANKMLTKMRTQGQMGYADIDALRDMIAFKLEKDGWERESTRLAVQKMGRSIY